MIEEKKSKKRKFKSDKSHKTRKNITDILLQNRRQNHH